MGGNPARTHRPPGLPSQPPTVQRHHNGRGPFPSGRPPGTRPKSKVGHQSCTRDPAREGGKPRTDSQ
eukprot:8693724-Alexandrium_andersonii.AAC.1